MGERADGPPHPPSTVDEALDQVDALLEAPSLVLLPEGNEHLAFLSRLPELGTENPLV